MSKKPNLFLAADANLKCKLAASLFFCTVLSGCQEPKNEPANPLKRLADDSGRFINPSRDNQLSFPDAHNPKKRYQQEWWYLTANLKTETGDTFGTQWTLFRRGVEDKHWYFAHAALADANQHLSQYRDGREELGSVSITSLPFTAEIQDWQWSSAGELLPATLQYGSRPVEPNQAQKVSETSNDWQVKLQLSAPAGFFLQGEQGFSQKHATLDIASHYYSQPFIRVTGQMLWQGKWQTVTGDAWFDREWGSQMLAEDQQGWDWFSLRLDKDTALMVYRIRSKIKDHMYASLMTRDGRIRAFSDLDVSITANSSSAVYPNAFSIAIPSESINLKVTTINDQQIMRMGIEYFEGMVRVTGSHTGAGFLEMTGYNN